MILKYKIDYRSSSLTYQKIFLKCLKECGLNGKILQDNFIVKYYVEADETMEFEKFATLFAKRLPHSIFLYDTEVTVCEEMPNETTEDIKDEKRLPLPFCLDCLEKIIDENSQNYYDIFTSCDICGYNIDGEHKNYKDEFERVAKLIENGENIELNTFYGNYRVGALNNISNNINFDIVAYDYATIKKYTHIEDCEVKALASFEKPFIKLKTNIHFNKDFENINLDLIRFKLPDDFILHLLMRELNKLGVNLIFITKDKINTENSLILVEPKEELEPIEVVVSQKHIAIVKGDKGLPKFPIKQKIIPAVDAFYSIIEEHKLTNENIAGIYLSKKYQNTILVHGQKYGTIEYLDLTFRLKSIKDIFEKISSTDDIAERLIKNYIKKFPEHYNRIINISFDNDSLNIYQLWGILSIILDFTKSDSIVEASKILEDNSISFLGTRGPRIDYKLIKIDGKTALNPLMIIRSAISFKIAGIDNLTLSYGIIESFAEFIANELDNIKENMNTDVVAIGGSLLENKKLFTKISKDCSINHNIYFNNQHLVEVKY